MPIVSASDGKGFHISFVMPFCKCTLYQVSVNPVEAIIAGGEAVAGRTRTDTQ
jgi:hypothetical protein